MVLAQESKVDVICLQPGIVDTPMARKLKKQVLVINSEECAESSLKAVGVSKRTFGHWKHWVAGAGFVIFKDVARRVARYM
jgi:short-subunit dehydrogenase